MTETTLPSDHATEPLHTAPAAPAPQRQRRPRGWMTVAAAAVVAALVSAGVTTAMTSQANVQSEAPQVQPAPAANRSSDPGDIAAVAAEVSPSVVHVAVAGLAGSGSGSGVVLREDGYVLTNAHVVDDAQQVRITLPDSTTHDAEVVGTDPASDLAVLHAEDATELPVPRFATTAPNVGDTAVALGSPFGLEGSVTSGIVSALNRNVAGNTTLVNMIQTDAAINPGNSGGALADGDGEIIGINSAILSPSGANDGIGFAIPITTALPIADQLIDKGYAEHAQLGIQGQDVDPEAAELYNLGVDHGALIVMVADGSAADDAGLQRGDIVTAIDGEEVASMADLAGQISAHVPGDQVELEIVRDGEPQSVDVTLGSAPRE